MKNRLFSVKTKRGPDPMRPMPLVEEFAEGEVSIDEEVAPIIEERCKWWLLEILHRETWAEKINGPSKPLAVYDPDSANTGINQWLLLDTKGRWYRIIAQGTDRLVAYKAESLVEEVEANSDKKTVVRWSLKACDGEWYIITRTPDNSLEVGRKCKPRHYTSSRRSTLVKNVKPYQHKEFLHMLYQEVCTNWRGLTDVRFKLLGLLPAVSIIVWGQLLAARELQELPGAVAAVAMCLLGLLIAIGIRVYDRRNDSLYDDLISRGRKLEEELKVDTGIFRGRRRPTNSFVNHTWAIRIIYGSVLLGWLGLLLWFGLIVFGQRR